MSGTGSPHLDRVDGSALRIGVVAAQWHQEIIAGLLDGVRRALDDLRVEHRTTIMVPGTVELSVAAARLARSDVDAIVALGVVVRGGTPHFEYVCQSATAGLTQVSVETGIPVGFGVLTCDTVEQALDRAGLEGSTEDKGYEAADAAVRTAVALAAANLDQT